jgi:hypothetical protein
MTQDIIRQAGRVTSFRWKCMDGRVITLAEMETKHIFNSMKMIFNHLAEAHGGEPVWFIKRYRDYERRCAESPLAQAEVIVLFLLEIERRGNLPEQYREPYSRIVEQIIPMQRRIEDSISLLTGDACS